MLVEKYRPKTFSEVVGREDAIKLIKEKIASPDGIPHLLMSGSAGLGKTSLAHVIANEIFGENKADLFFEFNASKDRGVEFIRTQISDIAKRNPISGKYKIILMDEADNITSDAQACFRRIIEQYSTITRFIFCANYPYKLIDPIISRFVQIEFHELDVKTIALQLKRIGTKEGMSLKDVEYIAIAKKSRGDMRRAINLLEGGNQENDDDKYWGGVTLESLVSMTKDERIMLAFKGDPEVIFSKLFDLIKNAREWKHLTALADCQSKMNLSVHKSVFLASFLEKLDK